MHSHIKSSNVLNVKQLLPARVFILTALIRSRILFNLRGMMLQARKFLDNYKEEQLKFQDPVEASSLYQIW